MKAKTNLSVATGLLFLTVACLPLLVAQSARGDTLEMTNGDRYNGKVLTVGETSVILENEVLGRITIPRGKVSSIFFGAAGAVTPNATPQPHVAGTNQPPVVIPKPSANSVADQNLALAQLRANPALVKKVENEYLAGADAAAHNKFQQLVSGLINGSLNLDDIRREAKTSADQMRAMRKDVGEDAGVVIDGYLAVLDQFLREAPISTTSAGTGTNSLPKLPAPPHIDDAD